MYEIVRGMGMLGSLRIVRNYATKVSVWVRVVVMEGVLMMLQRRIRLIREETQEVPPSEEDGGVWSGACFCIMVAIVFSPYRERISDRLLRTLPKLSHTCLGIPGILTVTCSVNVLNVLACISPPSQHH